MARRASAEAIQTFPVGGPGLLRLRLRSLGFGGQVGGQVARNDVTGRTISFPRRHCVRALHRNCPSGNRGRREGRVPAAPAAPVHQKARGRNTGGGGVIRPSLRNGVTVYTRSPRGPAGDRAFLPPLPASRSSSVSQAWPQRREARTTRFRRPRQHQSSCAKHLTCHVHRIPLPTFVTIAKRPSCGGGTGETMPLIWGGVKFNSENQN